MKSLARAALLSVAFFAPVVASAATSVVGGISNGGSFLGISWGSGGSVAGGNCFAGICTVAANILYLINFVLVPLLFAIAFIVFLYGIARSYIFSRGDPEEVRRGHWFLLWGLIGFFVMISLWGLVNVVANTFNLGGYNTPPTPYYQPYFIQ